MNTRQKIGLTFGIGCGVVTVVTVLVLYLCWKGVVSIWIALAVIPLPVFQRLIMVRQVRRLKERVDEAQSRGFILCSQCEYQIPETLGKAACPECGVVRSAAEHRKVDEDWGFWLR